MPPEIPDSESAKSPMHVILLVEPEATPKSLKSHAKTPTTRLRISHQPEEILDIMKNQWPNIIVLNLMTPLNNMAYLYQKMLKLKRETPILAIGEQRNPFGIYHPDTTALSPGELNSLPTAMTKALERQKNRFLRLPELMLDYQLNQISRDNKSHSLTPKQFKLLQILVENRDMVVSRKYLMQEVWDTDYMGDTRTLDVHIRWVREKLEADPSSPLMLRTVRGQGYIFMTQTYD